MSRYGNVKRSDIATSEKIVFSCGKEGCAWAQINEYRNQHSGLQIEGTLTGRCLAPAFGKDRLKRPHKGDCQGRVTASLPQQKT